MIMAGNLNKLDRSFADSDGRGRSRRTDAVLREELTRLEQFAAQGRSRRQVDEALRRLLFREFAARQVRLRLVLDTLQRVSAYEDASPRRFLKRVEVR